MRTSIRRFRGMESFSDAQIAFNDSEPMLKPDVNKIQDELFDVIFAPDPLTGWPVSSLAVVLNPNTPTEIKDFINQKMRIATPQHDGQDEQSIMDGISVMSYRNQYGAERQSNLNHLHSLIESYQSVPQNVDSND